jgi:hypothetical protein
MATIDSLLFDDKLVKYEPELPGPALAERMIYITPHFQDWWGDVLIKRKPSKGVSVKPYDQLFGRFDEFCAGKPFEYGRMFKSLEPKKSAVWELKTADVRVFGFFARRDCFVAVAGEMKSALRRYDKHIGIVADIRGRLALPWVAGGEIDDVISIKD